ncbi:MAD2 [Mytilus coruscus]|uniref:MAD2 n=1 Tax=Mytilus coruscus TaxID=42192 RepID=A0A6J8BXJ9_MYTCO|nr:MAD2 [Mytilus coruscus]
MESIDEPIASISFPLCSSTPLKPLIYLEPVSTDDEIQIVDGHFQENLQPLVSQQPDVTADDKQKKKEKKYAVVQYIHRDREEGDIAMKAHGNAKDSQSRPFFKTGLSVLDNIKEETRETKPRRLFKKLVDDAGGSLYSSSASSEPPDGESLQYVLASEKKTIDGFRYLLYSSTPFFCFFSVDSTFNIGNYYVTNTCFENLRVVHASGKYKGRHPLEMGPTFVHTHHDEDSYFRFFSALNRMNPNFRYQMQAIGSDGDEATIKAIATERNEATPAISHIVSDIFGTNVDSILYQKGLIDSETTSEFDSRLRDLKTTWDHLVPTFQAWFVSNESEKFKSHLIKAVTDQAQLDGHFSNNRVESTNNNVKDLVGRSGKVEEYVTCQQQAFEMAIYANGPYDLASTHTYLRKERHIWNGLNAEERKQVIKQFWKSNVQGRKLLDKFLLINEHAENRSKSDHTLPKPETRPNVSSKQEISYDDYQLQIPGISEDLLKEMF